jgi:hypothetical protein
MKTELLKNVSKTIVDGLKDTQMQYEYAEEAKEHGDSGLAKAHIAEAQKRIDGVQEWWKHSDSMAGGDPMYGMLMEYYRDWCRKLRHEIEEFKA